MRPDLGIFVGDNASDDLDPYQSRQADVPTNPVMKVFVILMNLGFIRILSVCQ